MRNFRCVYSGCKNHGDCCKEECHECLREQARQEALEEVEKWMKTHKGNCCCAIYIHCRDKWEALKRGEKEVKL